MSIPKYIPKKYAQRVAHWDDERSIGNSLIVTLRDLWRFTDQGHGAHVAGFDSVREALEALKETSLCACQDCTKKTKEAAQ